VHISYCRGRAIFTTRILESAMMNCSSFMHSDRSIFLQFTPLSAGPPFSAGVLKKTPDYGDFVTFDHLGNDPPRCSQSERCLTTRVTIMQEVRGSPIPFCKNFWGFKFLHFRQKLYRFSKKKSNSLNPYATTCVGQGCHSTCISPKYI